MIPILLKRTVHGVIVLWIVATFTFLLLRLAPGGPFDSERKLPPEVLANLEAKYHLDEPVLQQYARYLGGSRAAISVHRINISTATSRKSSRKPCRHRPYSAASRLCS